MSASQPISVPPPLGPIGYGDALDLDADASPGRTPVAVATQSWSAAASRSSAAADAPDAIGVKFMSRVQSGSMAGLCYTLDTPGQVRVSDIKAVHVVGDDGDRALVAFDEMGFRMVDGVHFVCKEEEERNAAMAYPISQEEYDLEYVQHCRKENRRKLKRKRGGDGDGEADNDNDSDYDPADGDAIYGPGADAGGNDSSDSDYDDDNEDSEDSDDSSLDGFIVHSSDEDEEQEENNSKADTKSRDDDAGFTHPTATCDNPDVKAMRSAASDYRKWTPKTDQERAAKALIDRIEARARHAEDEKRFRRGEAALEADR